MPKAAHPDNLTAGLEEALERSAKILGQAARALSLGIIVSPFVPCVATENRDEPLQAVQMTSKGRDAAFKKVE